MHRSPLLRAAFLATCGLFLSGAVTLAQELPQSQPNIRINVDRVDVGVIVTDSRGQFIQGLQRGDFRLFDNGVEQPITDFLSIDEPAQVLLLVEAGPSVYFLQGGHLHAAQTLLDGLAPGDRVAIARYDERAEPILNFIGDKRVAAGTLDQLHFNLGFGQLNLASSLLTALDWLVSVPGKKSVVLLSTGVDTSPPEAVQTMLARLKTTDVRVLSISLVGEMRAAPTADSKSAKKSQVIDAKAQFAAEGVAHADHELNAIADANASRAYFPQSNKDFTQVFAQISQLIRHEYSLGFNPPAHDAKIHSIEVSVAGSPVAAADSAVSPSYRVDYRKAYVAPAPEHE